MILYLILVLVAMTGIGGLIYRHRLVIFPSENSELQEGIPTFAIFMDATMGHVSGIWNDHIKVELFSLLEKGLRRIRLMILRIEHGLFRMTHRVKDISQRAEEVKAENAAIAAESSQNEPPSVQ